MRKTIVYFLALSLFAVSCSKSSSVPEEQQITNPPEPNEDAAKPISISFPNAYFIEREKAATGQSSYVIMNQLVSMLDAVPKNETVYVSIYLINYAQVIDAMIRASERGVTMNVIVDSSREDSWETNPAAIEKLRKGLKAPSTLTIVNSDASTTSINHNKFAVFSALNTTNGLAKKVVFQTSHNFTLADTRKIQDAIVLQHDGLYDAYRTYWSDMRSRAKSGMKNFEFKIYSDNTNGVSAAFLPRRSGGKAVSKDIIIELLDTISKPAETTIRIGMSDWVSRPAITDKLRELQIAGASIELVVKSSIGDDAKSGIAVLKANGAKVTNLNMTEPGQKINIHSKFLLLEGPMKSGATSLIATGSHNYTMNALINNNETLVMLENSPLFSKYKDYFKTLLTLPSLD